ncbi:SNF2-related protein [Synechococcus elongatus]|uniref:SNF2-related protein n=1 Tax=Synechococcus elongatus PCC 11801 TaxID=2219813 RepID=A0AAQ3RD55_SYNEL
MAVLHGGWLGDRFVLWAEAWQPCEPQSVAEMAAHPYAIAVSELERWCQKYGLGSLTGSAATEVLLSIPSQLKKETVLPFLSGQDIPAEALLWPWRISGLSLEAAIAGQWLATLPLGSAEDHPWLGPDLRFWSHIYRWAQSLLARGRFYPALESSDRGLTATWLPLFNQAGDRQRFDRYSQQLPFSQFCYQAIESAAACPWQPQPQDQLLQVLQRWLTARLQVAIASGTVVSADLLAAWQRSLAKGEPLELEDGEANRLQTAIDRWLLPVQNGAAQAWRMALRLVPPQLEERRWQLEFGLQAATDPDRFWPASLLWQDPLPPGVPDQAQELLLRGLGQACRLYPQLQTSLATACPEFHPLTTAEVYQLLKQVIPQWQEQGIEVQLPPGLRGQGRHRLGVEVSANLPSDRPSVGLEALLQFRWELSLGGQRLTKAEVERLAALETPLVEINGDWIEVRQQDIESAREFFRKRKDQPNLTLADAIAIASGESPNIGRLPVVNFEAAGLLEEALAVFQGQRSPAALPAPPTFQGELRPYQERGVGWLTFLQRFGIGACLADDMGLGKTIQLLAFLLHLKHSGELTRPVLLVCPTSVLGNWEREVQKFAPELRWRLHYGPDRAQGKALATALKDCDLVLTSYSLVARDQKAIAAIDWQGIVLDEAQNIKNDQAKQTQAVRAIAQSPTQKPRFRIALTGTPVENRLSELWSIVEFLQPGHLGTKPFFQKRFVAPIERFGDADSLTALRQRVQPLILRRLKTDRSIIADLPEKQEMTVFCPLVQEQADRYQQLVTEALDNIEASEGIQRRGQILALLTRLKQLCNHPSLLQEKPKLDSHFGDRSAKLQRLLEMLAELTDAGDRALVFTQFAGWGRLLQQFLQEQLGREVLFLSGSTKKGDRQQMVDRFQNDPQAPAIFILSLKAGGVGLNLTKANHVFHYDRWWNPAVENQATDRAFRIGQRRNVQVHKFVCAGTLEEKIDQMIASKQALAQQIVGSGEDWLTELDTNQLRQLLILDRSAWVEEEEP